MKFPSTCPITCSWYDHTVVKNVFVQLFSSLMWISLSLEQRLPRQQAFPLYVLWWGFGRTIANPAFNSPKIILSVERCLKHLKVMRQPHWCQISEGNVCIFVGRYFCYVMPSGLLEKADVNKTRQIEKKDKNTKPFKFLVYVPCLQGQCGLLTLALMKIAFIKSWNRRKITSRWTRR